MKRNPGIQKMIDAGFAELEDYLAELDEEIAHRENLKKEGIRAFLTPRECRIWDEAKAETQDRILDEEMERHTQLYNEIKANLEACNDDFENLGIGLGR